MLASPEIAAPEWVAALCPGEALALGVLLLVVLAWLVWRFGP